MIPYKKQPNSAVMLAWVIPIEKKEQNITQVKPEASVSWSSTHARKKAGISEAPSIKKLTKRWSYVSFPSFSLEVYNINSLKQNKKTKTCKYKAAVNVQLTEYTKLKQQ